MPKLDMYLTGVVYRGSVKEGKRHGQGIYKNSEGQVFEGRWENNRLVKG